MSTRTPRAKEIVYALMPVTLTVDLVVTSTTSTTSQNPIASHLSQNMGQKGKQPFRFLLRRTLQKVSCHPFLFAFFFQRVFFREKRVFFRGNFFNLIFVTGKRLCFNFFLKVFFRGNFRASMRATAI